MPDWHAFQRFNGSIVEFYGLWAYCQEQGSSLGTVCQRWPTAENELFNGERPSFVSTSDGLITTGMIFLSLGLIFAILAAALPFLAYLAAGLAFIAFVFLVVGLPIFGRQSDSFSASRGDVSYHKRYGFWLIVPTIVLEFLAVLAFLAAGLLYKLFGFGNLGTSFPNKTYGGQQMLGPPNMFNGPPNRNLPYGMRPPPMLNAPYSSMPFAGQTVSSLLSEYLSERSPQFTRPMLVRSASVSVLPQPTIFRSITPTPVPNVTPAYVRISEPPPFQPIINLTGQTLVGPLRRIS